MKTRGGAESRGGDKRLMTDETYSTEFIYDLAQGSGRKDGLIRRDKAKKRKQTGGKMTDR